jgi:TolA-binding protein
MQSTPNLRDTDPHDVFVIEPDVVLAARADKAPLDQLYDVLSKSSDPQPSNAEVRIAPDFSATAPSVGATARASTVDDILLGDTEISAHQQATSKFARRAVMGLLALGSAVGAAAWQHYGDDAKAMVASWTPPFALASTPPVDAPRSATPAVAATADQAAAPSASSAQPAQAPVTAAVSPDQTQIQSMASDIAAMSQQIEQLKASIAEIKAGQVQASREPARATEARLAEPPVAVTPPVIVTRPRIVPPPPHAAVAPVRRPKQVFPYAPIAPAPPPPAAGPVSQTAVPSAQFAPQAQTAADGGPVVRPPMPVH